MWYPAEVDVSIRPGWFYHEHEDTLVKSAEQLVDIYYGSVGRNAAFLLNVPPDRRGRIPEPDAASLRGMHDILRTTFAANLAAPSHVTASDSLQEHSPRAVLDTSLKTFWTVGEAAETVWLELRMPEPVAFDRAMLQEAFRWASASSIFAWRPGADALGWSSRTVQRRNTLCLKDQERSK